VTADDALLELLTELRARAYSFVAVTPATHGRVLARPAPAKLTLRDVFGWNRYFSEDQVDPRLLALLRAAGALEETQGRFRSLVRVATLDGELFLHSAFPTDAAEAVFFGPDTYRFARSIAAHLTSMPAPSWVVDMGAGSGAGAIVAGKCARPRRLTMVDVNPLAGRLARVNASSAGIAAEITVGTQVPNGCDLVLANPPYLMDETHRTYRDGGESLGSEVACVWTSQSPRRSRCRRQPDPLYRCSSGRRQHTLGRSPRVPMQQRSRCTSD